MSIVRTKMYECKCKLCGNIFTAKSPKAVYCKEPHIRVCPVCGSEYTLRDLAKPEKTCSKECRHKLANLSRELTSMNKYGVKSTLSVPDIRNKIRQTCNIKYGVDNPYQADAIKEKIRKTNFIRYGVENAAQNKNVLDSIKRTNRKRYGGNAPLCDDRVKDKSKQTCMERYGVDNPIKSEEIKSKIRQTCINRYGVDNFAKSDLWYDRVVNTNQLKYGEDFYSQTRDAHIKMSDTRKQCIASDGTKLEGSYELKVYEYCLIHKISVERQISIKFNYGGKEHTTFIDFRVDDKLVECKGGHLLQGCFDYAGHIPIDTKLQVYRDNDVLLIVDSVGYNHIKENNKYDLNKVLLIDNIDMLEQMLQV